MQQKTSYHLGAKTFFFLVLQRAVNGIIILLAALVIIGLKGILLSNIIIANFTSVINWAVISLLSVGLLMLVSSLIIARLQYSVSTIMVDDVSLHISRGVFGREELAIPYRRIQSVEIKQTFLYRVLGLARVIIATTTSLEQPSQIKSEANEEVIPIIDYQLALGIEKILVDEAQVERMKIEK